MRAREALDTAWSPGDRVHVPDNAGQWHIDSLRWEGGELLATVTCLRINTDHHADCKGEVREVNTLLLEQCEHGGR